MEIVDITRDLSHFYEINLMKGVKILWQYILKRDSNGTTTIIELAMP